MPLPTEGTLKRVEAFHDNLSAALDWSTNDPALGLRLLRCLATVWSELGWFGEGALAVEGLLTLENAERHAEAWLDAVFASHEVVLGAFEDSRVWHDLTVRAEQVAGAHGDGFRLAIARYFTGDVEEMRTLRELARQRGDLYWQALPAVDLASHVVEDDPIAARPLLADADTLAQATGSRSLRDELILIRARAARTEGDLRACIELGLRLLETRGLSRPELLHIVSFAALLAMDERALRAVAEKRVNVWSAKHPASRCSSSTLHTVWSCSKANRAPWTPSSTSADTIGVPRSGRSGSSAEKRSMPAKPRSL